MHTNLKKHRRLGAFITLVAAVQLSACNFDVTNPGPVQDSFLNDSLAFVAIVNGMGRDLSDGLNYLAFHGVTVPPGLNLLTATAVSADGRTFAGYTGLPYQVREGGSFICFVRDPDAYRVELIEQSNY